MLERELPVGSPVSWTSRLVLNAGALLLAAGLKTAALDAPLILTQVPREDLATTTATAPRGLHREDGFSHARLVLVKPALETVVLSDGFASACDPDVSCDGKRILFAGRRDPSAAWAIWQVSPDGKNPRRITNGDDDCRSPVYGARLFTLDAPAPWQTIIYAGRNSGLIGQGSVFSVSLYAANLDGSESRRITFNPDGDFDPFQMWDGRVLYASRQYAPYGGRPSERVALFGVNIDGTDHELYTAASGPRIRHMACATEKGLVVFVETDAGTGDGGGQLASVRERRPHHSYRKLTEAPEFVYLYPSPLTNNEILVTRRAASGDANCGVYRFDADTGRIDLVFDSPDYHDVQAKLVRPRPLPDGRSTPVDPKQSTGILYGLNCYDADARLQPHLPPGTIRSLRVIEGVPIRSGSSVLEQDASSSRTVPGSKFRMPAISRRLLGEAPIEEDGSFQIEIPADISVELQAVDEHGMALATCRWIWVKPKEKRGCIGCHEDPERIPENDFVSALKRPANQLTLPSERRRSVAFREHVMPIIGTKCATADCHGGNDTPLRMTAPSGTRADEDARTAYAALVGPSKSAASGGTPGPAKGPYVNPGQARTSFLIWQILGKQTERPWDRHGTQAGLTSPKINKMPPPDQPSSLTRDEVRTFVEWIDLGAQWEAAKQTTDLTWKAEPASK